MKTFKKLLAALLMTCAAAQAAITERYVASSAAGDGTGSSGANAMSFTDFTDYMSTGGSFTATAGDRFNVISGTTYARTTTSDTWVNGGTSTSPVIVRGYTTTIGDANTPGRTNDNGALITTNMPVYTTTTGLLTLSGNFLLVEGINFSSTRNGTAINDTGIDNVLRGCVVSNATSGASGAAFTFANRGTLLNCDITLSNGGNAGNVAINSTAGASNIIACRITSTAGGISSNQSLRVVGNTIYSTTGIALSQTGTTTTMLVQNNTFVGGGADAINIVTASTGQHLIVGNMFTDNTGDGIDMVSTGNSAILAYNRTRDNGSAIANGGDWVTATSWGHVTTDTGGSETDYTNFGAGDFSLIAASPATGAGIPKKASIGALQRDQTGSGAGQKSFTFSR